MEFMENARINNPIRSLKYKSLLEKQVGKEADPHAKKELRRMRQQEEDWASISGMIASDDELLGYGNNRRRKDDRHSDLAFYQRIKIND